MSGGHTSEHYLVRLDPGGPVPLELKEPQLMNKRFASRLGVGVGAVALMAASALPAWAAAGDTATTFALAGGTLAVSVQATATLTRVCPAPPACRVSWGTCR